MRQKERATKDKGTHKIKNKERRERYREKGGLWIEDDSRCKMLNWTMLKRMNMSKKLFSRKEDMKE